MAMEKRYCISCSRTAWHNSMKESGRWRCTFCGSPVSTNPAKRDQQEVVRKQQASKPGRD